jgi:hypothetical protein
MTELEKQFWRISYLLDDNIKMETRYRMCDFGMNSTGSG